MSIKSNLLSRTITEYPRAYKIKQTPYQSIDFDIDTKIYCDKCKLKVPDLKMCKVIVLGDVAVGKSCLVNRFCHQLFATNYKATIGVDYEVEQFQILDIPFQLQIWDTAGQERFKSIAQSYYRFARVFDLCKINSLNNCNTWLQEALQASSKNPHIFLVGTKKDLVSAASYNCIETMAMAIANNMNAEFWAVSAQTGNDVNALFFRVAALSFEAVMINEKSFRDIPLVENEVICKLKSSNSKVYWQQQEQRLRIFF